jgi:hypothetical protein
LTSTHEIIEVSESLTLEPASSFPSLPFHSIPFSKTPPTEMSSPILRKKKIEKLIGSWQKVNRIDEPTEQKASGPATCSEEPRD